jgi:hypothetical protein
MIIMLTLRSGKVRFIEVDDVLHDLPMAARGAADGQHLLAIDSHAQPGVLMDNGTSNPTQPFAAYTGA